MRGSSWLLTPRLSFGMYPFTSIRNTVHPSSCAYKTNPSVDRECAAQKKQVYVGELGHKLDAKTEQQQQKQALSPPLCGLLDKYQFKKDVAETKHRGMRETRTHFLRDAEPKEKRAFDHTSNYSRLFLSRASKLYPGTSSTAVNGKKSKQALAGVWGGRRGVVRFLQPMPVTHGTSYSPTVWRYLVE